MNDLKDISVKLMCVFFHLFPRWKQFVAKWLNNIIQKVLEWPKVGNYWSHVVPPIGNLWPFAWEKKGLLKSMLPNGNINIELPLRQLRICEGD